MSGHPHGCHKRTDLNELKQQLRNSYGGHLKDVNVIPGNQSAYRENHSTETTVCSIMNDMIQMVSEGKCGILVTLDLSAAVQRLTQWYMNIF